MLHDLNKTLKLPEISLEQAMSVIENENGLAKTLIHERDNPTNLLNQLADPANIRPVKDINGTRARERNVVYNPKTGAFCHRNINKKRGAPKPPGYLYTKKTSTTLLPTNGRIKLYRAHTGDLSRVGLLFNLKECNLKDCKYIFKVNASTDSKFWVGRSFETDALPSAVTLEFLRSLNREKAKRENEIGNNNEILAGLSKKSVTAVFAISNNFYDRLDALVMQNEVRKILGIVVPVLIINGTRNISVYTKKDQEKDLQSITKQDTGYIRRNFSPDFARHLEKTLDIPRPNYDINQAMIDLQASLENDTLQTFLETLDFVMLEDVMDELEHNEKKSADLRLNAALLAEYKKRKEIDLAELRDLLQSKFGIISIENMNQQDFCINDLSESTKKRLAIHLSYLNPAALTPLFDAGYYDQRVFDTAILHVKYFPSQMIQPYHQIVLAQPEGSSVYCVTHNSISISPLTIRIMRNSKSGITQLIPLIIRHQAQHLESILKNLIELEAFSRKYGAYCIYSSYTIENVIHAIALKIESMRPHVSRVTLTAFDEMLANNLSHDKRRTLETTLLSQVKQLTTKEDVYSFYRNHGDTVALTHQRHSTHGLFPTIKVNVLTALQTRLTQISNTGHTSTLIENETEGLKAELVNLLNDKKSRLSEKSFVSFFTPSSTQQKIRQIGSIIDNLRAIQSLDALRFFVATLMINNDLVGRRIPGFSLSDTALKLQAFYQQAFITTNHLH